MSLKDEVAEIVSKWDLCLEEPLINARHKDIAQSITELIEGKIPKKTPNYKDFMRVLEWNEKHRGTDSQLFNDGYNQAIQEFKKGLGV